MFKRGLAKTLKQCLTTQKSGERGTGSRRRRTILWKTKKCVHKFSDRGRKNATRFDARRPEEDKGNNLCLLSPQNRPKGP